MTVGFETIAGWVVTIAIAVIGYFVKQLNNTTTEIKQTIKCLEDDAKKARHDMRGELSKVVLQEEVRRKEAIGGVELRVNEQIKHVIMLINTTHTDLKSDIRTVQDDIRTLLLKDRA